MELSKEEMTALGNMIRDGSTPGSLYSVQTMRNLRAQGLAFRSSSGRGYYRATPEGKAMYELLSMAG